MPTWHCLGPEVGVKNAFLSPSRGATYNCDSVRRISIPESHKRMTTQRFRIPAASPWKSWQWLGCLLVFFACPVQAADLDLDRQPNNPAKNLAALVRVHLPLTGSADQVLQTTIRRTRDQLLDRARLTKDARRPVLVLQLEPQPDDSGQLATSQFERAFALARFLCSREMAEVKTVAFVPRSLRGHGVLLALACEEIVMSGDAMIGDAGAEEDAGDEIRQTLVAAYREIAETQKTIPIALAVAMIDPGTEVLQVEAEDGTHFVTRSELRQFSSDHEVIKEKVLVPAGSLAQFDGREGRQLDS